MYHGIFGLTEIIFSCKRACLSKTVLKLSLKRPRASETSLGRVRFDNFSDKFCPNFSESVDLILQSDTFFHAVGGFRDLEVG